MRSAEDAGNLTQEVFLKVWENRHRLDPGQSFNAYLFTVARNTIFNMHRKKLNEIAYLDQLETSASLRVSETERAVNFRELMERLDRCVDRLPPRQKEVFSLSRKDGLSHREISHRMGIAEKTIAAHIRLALQSLRRCLSME
jgi:RNA polymerase sigma-70 factor (ECF subfamily)